MCFFNSDQRQLSRVRKAAGLRRSGSHSVIKNHLVSGTPSIIFSSADIIRPVRDRILEAIDDYGRGAEAVSIEADHVSGKQQSLELFGKAHWGFLIRRRHGVCLLHGQSGALMHNLF